MFMGKAQLEQAQGVLHTGMPCSKYNIRVEVISLHYCRINYCLQMFYNTGPKIFSSKYTQSIV